MSINSAWTRDSSSNASYSNALGISNSTLNRTYIPHEPLWSDVAFGSSIEIEDDVSTLRAKVDNLEQLLRRLIDTFLSYEPESARSVLLSEFAELIDPKHFV